MEIQVLGCSGGIGGSARTTSFLVDGDILIDAGTGVGDLDTAALTAIDTVFLSHAHLDHTTSLPLLLDSVGPLRDKPITVYAQAETIAVLKSHMFNWKLWPDFSEIPNAENPYLTFTELAPGNSVTLEHRYIQSIAVEHTVPAVGFLVRGSGGSFAFSGDTTHTDNFWSILNKCPDLRYLVIETTFLNKDRELSELSKHLCPSMVADELQKLTASPEIYITHLMPGCEDAIMREIERSTGRSDLIPLKRGHVFKL